MIPQQPKEGGDGETMRNARSFFLWSQRQAAEALGLTIAQISAIENGRSRMTRQTRVLLAAYEERMERGGGNTPFRQWTRQ